MTILKTVKITSKGQVTIPSRVRKLLHLEDGSCVGFGITKSGILLVPCKLAAVSPYTPGEWAKIENIASAKGKIYKTSKEAKRHIEAL